MSMKEQIIGDLTAAMKAREALRLETLRMLKTAIMNYEVSGANKIATDEVVTDLVKKGIKQRKESAEAFDKGGKPELAKKERAEIVILEAYMPEQMSENEVKKVVSEVINQMSATQADFGKVMGATMGKLKGNSDGNLVSAVVKELLK